MTISASSRASGTSALLSTTTRVRSDSGRPPRSASGTYAASSASMTSKSVIGSRPGSSVAQSTTWTSTEQRSTWRRNSSPRPLPRWAPGIRPGTSAMVNRADAGRDHTEVGHQRGEGVVGDLRPGRGEHGDQRGLARRREADQRDVGERLQLQDDVDGRRRARRAARSPAPCDVATTAPCCRDPRGRRARRRTRCPWPTRSASSCPSPSLTTVPCGTARTMSPPSAPLRSSPAPGRRCRPCGAVSGGSPAAWSTCGSTRSTTDAAASAVAAVGAAERLELLPLDRGHAVAAVACRRRAGRRGRRSRRHGGSPSGRSGRQGRRGSQWCRDVSGVASRLVRSRRVKRRRGGPRWPAPASADAGCAHAAAVTAVDRRQHVDDLDGRAWCRT